MGWGKPEESVPLKNIDSRLHAIELDFGYIKR
jgi:hypothetical protein